MTDLSINAIQLLLVIIALLFQAAGIVYIRLEDNIGKAYILTSIAMLFLWANYLIEQIRV